MKMCNLCNGTGGINIEHSWGIHFAPCPNTNCDFDEEKAWKETQEIINKLRKDMGV